MEMDLQQLGARIQNLPIEEEETRLLHHKQFKLLLPPDLAEEVQRVAQSKGMKMAELIRFYIRLGLELTAQLEPGARLIIQVEGKRDRQIIIPL